MPAVAAVRELAEESGIGGAQVVADLGLWDAGFNNQIWSFQLCEVKGPLPERWAFATEDDGGHVFEFFWQPLHEALPLPCHPVFQAALVQVREQLRDVHFKRHDLAP